MSCFQERASKCVDVRGGRCLCPEGDSPARGWRGWRGRGRGRGDQPQPALPVLADGQAPRPQAGQLRHSHRGKSETFTDGAIINFYFSGINARPDSGVSVLEVV